ncbi:FecR family protein [Sinomicrobium sp.]
MNRRDKLESLLEKYMRGNADAEEVDQLMHILQEKDNDVFPDAVRMVEFIDVEHRSAVDSGKRDEILQKILQAKKKHRSIATVSRRKRFRLLTGAAVVLLLSLGTYTVYKSFTVAAEQEIDNTQALEGVVIKLASGETRVLTEQQEIVNATGDVIGVVANEVLKVNALKNADYDGLNEIRVPYGRRFSVTLPDSTAIFLNSGSALQYASSFGIDSRSVTLIGEAYFEVAKDSSKPFTVRTGDLSIKVLGTHFNVHNYKSDKSVETVLLEGKVALYADEGKDWEKEAVVMTPGTLAVFDKQERDIELRNETNAFSHIAWIQGEMIFEKRTFCFILQTLERRFDVEIVNNNQKLSEARFTAKFDKHSLQEILESFRQSFPFEYTINNQRIIINTQE